MPDISFILHKSLDQSLTSEEQQILNEWLSKDVNNQLLWQQLNDPKYVQAELVRMQAYEAERIRGKMQLLAPLQLPDSSGARHLTMKWLRYAAAVIILFGGGAYLYVNHSFYTPSPEVTQQIIPATEVLPGGNRATLTLADGRTIVLDSAAGGELAREGFSKITKKSDGVVEYIIDQRGASPAERSVALNTMRTPKGGMYQLILPDGSKAWLNALSSIRYPTSFSERERHVEITGEVYFQIAHNSLRPFKVSVQNMEVEVLGTTFNVNAYGDNSIEVETTLLNGSVLLRTANAVTKLNPGQQGQVMQHKTSLIVRQVDTAGVMAWKNGYFNFTNESLETTLNQLARWYDLHLHFEGNVKRTVHLKGKMQRALKLSEVLEGLDAMNLRTRLEAGNNLYILH